MILQVENLTHAFGDKLLYRNAAFAVHEGEHVGVVGRNGAGKSTLMRILMGEVIADEGKILWRKNARVGQLTQYAHAPRQTNTFAYLQEAFGALYRAEAELNGLYAAMAQGQTVDTDRISHLQAKLETENFYGLDAAIRRVAAGLGLADGLARPLGTLSGGQRERAILARLLLEAPEMLLLDEPTNFLDQEHVAWLAGYLASFPGAYLIVSHDGDFLNQATTHILDIDLTSIRKYTGSYAHFLRQKEAHKEAYETAYRAQQKQIERLEAYIRKNKVRAATAQMAKGRQKMLDRIDRIPPPIKAGRPSIQLPALSSPLTRPLVVEKLLIGYGRPLLPPLNLKLSPGEKLVITGFNGVGKTTLLRTLMGELPALGGRFAFADGVRVAYLEQETVWPYGEMSPLQLLLTAYPALTPKDARARLAACGLKADLMVRPIATLSGGEQTKVKLCRLTLTPGNLLLLDEPTNHLDQETKEAFRQALIAYPGSLILVSHEAAFYKGLATRVMAIGGEEVNTRPRVRARRQ